MLEVCASKIGDIILSVLESKMENTYTLKIDLIGKIMNLFFLEGKTKNSRHILIESSLCKRISLNS